MFSLEDVAVYTLAISFSQNVKVFAIFFGPISIFLNKSDSSSRISAGIFHLLLMIAGCEEFKQIGNGEIFCIKTWFVLAMQSPVSIVEEIDNRR